MTKRELAKEISITYKMGELENYVHQILCEEANNYVKNNYPKVSCKEESILQEAYINGFYGGEENENWYNDFLEYDNIINN
tara:strand:- start:1321 stop:1563 length:243 start_codon:yes stop_codon:yes gene_type:complete